MFQIFEVGDVALLDDTRDVGAKNLRQLGALYCGANAGFEVYDASFGCLVFQYKLLNVLYFTPIIT